MKHEDLRETGHRREFSLDIRIISTVSVFLAVTGILIGGLLPTLLEEDYTPSTTSWEERLDTYLLLSMDGIEYNGTSYEELDMTTVFSLMIMDEVDLFDETLDRTYELLSFTFPEASSYKLTISRGTGWDMEYVPLVMHNTPEPAEDEPISFGKEVQVVSDTTTSRTLLFEMEIWGV